jgi:hypothetical protein
MISPEEEMYFLAVLIHRSLCVESWQVNIVPKKASTGNVEIVKMIPESHIFQK